MINDVMNGTKIQNSVKYSILFRKLCFGATFLPDLPNISHPKLLKSQSSHYKSHNIPDNFYDF